MKSFAVFSLYFSLGLFLIFSYKRVIQTVTSQQLKTPISSSSFSLENAPSESLRATIVSLSGDVSWQSRTATQPAEIFKPIQIQQGEKIVTKENGRAKIVFSGKAEIILNPKTEIDFIQTLPGNILIEQVSGFAEYNALTDALNVRSQGLLIKISTGNVSMSVSESEPYLTADVKTGSITAGYNDLNYITKVSEANAGERLIYRTDVKKVNLIPFQ